jgi:tRNA threonylcarbamoyladenosine biosynthesis protein TsaB
MKLYLDCSSPKTILELDNQHYEWDSGRSLARDLLKFIHDKLVENQADWQDLTELHYYVGPGSFTGLRIGATVINTLGDQLKIPIYNQRGEKLELAMPEYGREANITPPKK